MDGHTPQPRHADCASEGPSPGLHVRQRILVQRALSRPQGHSLLGPRRVLHENHRWTSKMYHARAPPKERTADMECRIRHSFRLCIDDSTIYHSLRRECIKNAAHPHEYGVRSVRPAWFEDWKMPPKQEPAAHPSTFQPMHKSIIERCGDTLDESHMPLGWPMSKDGAVRQFCMHKTATIQELDRSIGCF